MNLRVAFQGEPGAYSEAAALGHFGPKTETVPCDSFEKVFQAVCEGQVQRGLIPIENSLAGSIHRNYDLLLQNPLWVVGEQYLQIHHCLITLPGVRMEDIRKVISHPQALAQCDGYLRGLPGVVVEQVYDTAGSVKIMRDMGNPQVAAIASKRAAEIYGMAVLVEGIEDRVENFTRFLAISMAPEGPGKNAKTSIVFALQNRPGSLFKALSVFSLRDIDLTKIESRPYPARPWDYLFYIDFAGSTEEEGIQRALGHLGEYATMLRILGSYPRGVIAGSM